MAARDPDAIRVGDFVPLALGLAALAVGTLVGWNAAFVDAVVQPIPIIRASLVGVAAVAGGALLIGGLRRMGSSRIDGASTPDLPTMVRGVRLVFLAVAAWAAGVGWVLGHPLPLVIAFVIAGIDVLETSFLLLVVRRRAR
jgi:hypothetical protein